MLLAASISVSARSNSPGNKGSKITTELVCLRFDAPAVELNHAEFKSQLKVESNQFHVIKKEQTKANDALTDITFRIPDRRWGDLKYDYGLEEIKKTVDVSKNINSPPSNI